MFLRSIFARPGSHLLLLVAATLLLYFGVAIVGRAAQMYELYKEESRLRQELSALETRRQEILRLKDMVSADAYIEQVAREQLGLVTPGEIGVVVLTPASSPRQASPLPSAQTGNGTSRAR